MTNNLPWPCCYLDCSSASADRVMNKMGHMHPWPQENSLRATWLTNWFIPQLPFQVASDYHDFFLFCKSIRLGSILYVFLKMLWIQVEMFGLIFNTELCVPLWSIFIASVLNYIFVSKNTEIIFSVLTWSNIGHCSVWKTNSVLMSLYKASFKTFGYIMAPIHLHRAPEHLLFPFGSCGN